MAIEVAGPRKRRQYTTEERNAILETVARVGVIWAATRVDNPYVKGIGITGGGVEAIGGSAYLGGALTRSAALMATGAKLARFGGGVSLTVVSGYQFIRDIQHGDVGGAIGSGANTATGVTMLVTTNPFALAAAGTLAISYNGSRWIRSKTGWGDLSARAGGATAKFLMGSDPGASSSR